MEETFDEKKYVIPKPEEVKSMLLADAKRWKDCPFNSFSDSDYEDVVDALENGLYSIHFFSKHVQIRVFDTNYVYVNYQYQPKEEVRTNE